MVGVAVVGLLVGVKVDGAEVPVGERVGFVEVGRGEVRGQSSPIQMVGTRVGLIEGEYDGDNEGSAVEGNGVGNCDGLNDGAFVGDNDGSAEGKNEGDGDGSNEGLCDGSKDGEYEGKTVGSVDGDGVGW